MIESYIKLGIATLIPVIVSVAIYLVDEKTPAKNIPGWIKQLLIGIIFGGIAIIGTEWGIPVYDDNDAVIALVNCRDAAPICAGLLFGAPAGIIAGLIGGIERFVAVAWGAGEFTRYACSIATVVAGLAAAFLRKKMFDSKRPGWLLALAIAFVAEVFHLLLVFLLNTSNTVKAAEVVEACTAPMLIANSVAVMLSALFISILSKDFVRFQRSGIRIAQTMQRWLLLCVTIAFAATMFFTISVQTNIAKAQTKDLLKQGINDIVINVEDQTGDTLLAIADDVVDKITTNNPGNLAKECGVEEITIVGADGVVRNSSNVDLIGYNFADDEKSAEFLAILRGEDEEYVQEYGPTAIDPDTSRKYAGIQYNDGFIVVGIGQDQFKESLALLLEDAAHNRHIGKNGFAIILDSDLNVISAPEEIDISDFPIDDIKNQDSAKLFYEKYDGEEYCVYYVYSEGYYLVSTMPSSEAFYSRNLSIYINSFMEVVIFAIMFVLIFLLVNRVIVKKLQNINSDLAEITKGKLDTVIDVRSNYEFNRLSDGINRTVDSLKDYIKEAEARIDAELEFARNIQTSALPSVFPNRDEFDIYATMHTAKEVGGDFYDFYSTHHNILNFLIADVSGKGIPASLFMMRAKTELKSLTETGMSLDEVFTKGNDALCEGNDAGMFVTAWQGCLDTQTGKILFANAGHNAPAIRHADGSFEYLSSKPGFVLAGMEGVQYKIQETKLEPGDIIFTYTDGVTEATNSNEELYGEQRLLDILNRSADHSMEELCKAVKADVDEFVGDAPQFDDITMLAVRYKG